MSAQANVQVDGRVVSVEMGPKTSKKGTPGYWGQARLPAGNGDRYVVQVSAWRYTPNGGK